LSGIVYQIPGPETSLTIGNCRCDLDDWQNIFGYSNESKLAEYRIAEYIQNTMVGGFS